MPESLYCLFLTNTEVLTIVHLVMNKHFKIIDADTEKFWFRAYGVKY